jgi:hypothetical protein
MKRTAAYYYANGERIALELDPEYVAVNLSRSTAGLRATFDRLKKRASSPVRDMALVRRDELSPDDQGALDAAGAIQPVYRHGSAMIVVLPEVRVDIEKAERPELISFVKNGSVPAAIEQDERGRLVLRPMSGSGADALALANGVHETLHPKVAQASFLRVIPKPAL